MAEKVKNLVIVYGGPLAQDVAERLLEKKPSTSAVDVTLRNASERPKTLLDYTEDTVVCFVIQTIENENPTEEVSLDVLTFILPTTTINTCHDSKGLAKSSFNLIGLH
jgi:hypothetical protein